MKAQTIFFFKENIRFRLLNQDSLRAWILSRVKKAGYSISNINFIFCSDSYLRKMNKEYLEHDYNTDIITFDNSIVKKEIIGDVFISIDRVTANAKNYSVTFNDELHRVMAHGVLHLLGYGDKNEKQKEVMRRMENEWLGKRGF